MRLSLQWKSKVVAVDAEAVKVSLRRLLQFLLISASLWRGIAQDARGRFIIDSWQTDEGLPQNSVISMTQAKDGYLWLATFNGLVRFDGVRFTVFNSHNTPALDSSRIIRVWEDRSGVLWIGTESAGIIRREKGVFKRLDFGKTTHLNLISDGRDGDVWFTLSDGRLVHYAGGRVEEKRAEWGLNEVSALATFVDGNTLKLWTNQGLYEWNGQRFVAVKDGGPSFFNNTVNMAASPRGGWWRTLGSGAAKIVNGKKTIEHDASAFLKALPSVILETQSGGVWIGTAGAGLIRIDPSGEIDRIAPNHNLATAQVRSLLEDREGNIWVGTDGAGLHRLRRAAFSVLDKAAGLGADIALATLEEDGDLWIGTNGGGLTRVGADEVETINAQEVTGLDHIWSLLRDREGTLWVGTWGSGIFRRKGPTFVKDTRLTFGADIVLAVHEDPAGILWFGGINGLISKSKTEIRHYKTTDGLSHNDVRGIIDDGEGGIWIATNGGGLNRYKNGKFSAIRQSQGLADDAVWTLYRDAENTLWVGTFGGGISVIRGGKIQNYAQDDGLPSSVICSISEDARRNLWISSYHGVFTVPKDHVLSYRRGGTRLQCRTFTKSDGLPSRECTGSFQPSVCKMSDGRLIFPTVKGAAIVDPEKLPHNSLPPPVVIEEVDVNGEAQVLGADSSLRIPPGKEQIQFRYTALSFSSPEKVRFRYKLEGLDKDWNDADTRRVAYYPHLPPGDYRFRVIACNNDGVWNEAGSAMRVEVVPAFWQTWWFLAACVLIAGGVIAGTIRYVEVRKLRRKMELLEQQHAVERERARIAKDIHDDLGASLTQITLLSELARTDLPRPAEAEAHIRQISGTARELTRAMDEIVWAVDPQKDTLEDLLTYTVKFAQEHLGIARIRCRVDAPANLPPLHLSAEVRHNLFLAIKEAINNIAKHSKATEAWLRLRPSTGGFIVEVEDNGIGLNGKPSTPGSHNGLINMERRLREIGGSFQAARRADHGTILRFKINLTGR